MLIIPKREVKKRVGKKYIMSERVFKARYSFFLHKKMYRSAELILYQWLKYNRKIIQECRNRLIDEDIAIMHLILECDYSSVMYILTTIEGPNYFSINNKNIQSISLRACENRDYYELYKICQAYIGNTEMLSVGNLAPIIPFVCQSDQLLLLKIINNPSMVRNTL